MFGTKKTLDGILSDFQKVADDLQAFSESKEAEAKRLHDEAKEIALRRDRVANDIERAKRARARALSLLGE